MKKDRGPRLTACGLIALALVAAATRPVVRASADGPPAGKITVYFMYEAPGEVHPTYHTAMWLEDEKGHLAKTLFVTQELSATEYKVGEACPDWVNKAAWEKAPQALVDAVTGPTPDVGSGMREFDLASLGLAPGTYRFNFQVHIIEKHNLLFRGNVVVGGKGGKVEVEALRSPGIPDELGALVRGVQVTHVVPASR